MSVATEVSTADELITRLEQARNGAFYNQVAVANVADILALRNINEQLRQTLLETQEKLALACATQVAIQARLDYYTAHDRRLWRLGIEFDKTQKQAKNDHTRPDHTASV